MTHRNFFWPMTLISVIWLWLTWWWFEFIFVNNMALFLKLLLNIFFQALSSQSQLKIAQWNFENLTFFVDLTKNAVKWNRLKMSSLKEVEWSWKSKQANVFICQNRKWKLTFNWNTSWAECEWKESKRKVR